MNLLTVEEIAKELKVTRQTIYQWRKDGMPFLRMGRLIRFEQEKVMEWLKENARLD